MIRMDDITVVGDKEDGYTTYRVRAVKYFECPLHYTDVEWMVKTELEDLLQRVSASEGESTLLAGEYFDDNFAEALETVLSYYKAIVSDDHR